MASFSAQLFAQSVRPPEDAASRIYKGSDIKEREKILAAAKQRVRDRKATMEALKAQLDA